MTLDHIFRKASHLSVPLICCMLIGYFAYHAFYGGNGIIAAKRLNARIAVLNEELDYALGIREKFEMKVSLMRPESLDPDLVDEFARGILGKAHKNDIVILRPHPPSAPGYTPIN